ncbi:MAG: UDP-N-acetylmuramoyl-L-alanyl-D-glutamate--2,6-diaminopimelate ligase [bacterium]|nr:UDP-N-acetylmuramoyl-L-alanyl-D-glutamate--2,6-diaminopimelate ligase [bacterium]
MRISLKFWYHYFLAWLGSVIYKRPSEKLLVIGITGTKGKSTVMELVNAILELAGKKTALISSVRIKVDKESRPNLTGMTMPGRFFIQKFLREAADKDCQYAIVEVTSQGILQHRDRFIDFDAALITNLEPEHIEAHGSFEKYRFSKVRFFRNVALLSRKPDRKFFINSKMKDYDHFASAASLAGNAAKIIPYNRKDIEKYKLKTKLLGEFNLENIAAAIALARSQNLDWDIVREAIEEFGGVPGRLEFIQKEPFSVVIDYAHTPDSLEKVYKTLSHVHRKGAGRLICVLGAAGGGRDVWKRPVMGEIAARYCHEIILTNEDPFDEDPNEIIHQITEGIKNAGLNKKFKILMDRRDAIRAAVKTAKKGDTVIITGKGSEAYMRLANNKKIPWNEREIVSKILNNERIEI